MMKHGKLILGLVIAGLFIWVLRSSQESHLIYPIQTDETKQPRDRLPVGVDLKGKVTWKGPKPMIPQLRRPLSPYYQLPDSMVPNPLAPKIGPESGLSEVFVLLESDELDRYQVNYQPLTVIWDQFDCSIQQGQQTGRFGIVGIGDEVTFVSHQDKGHSARVRGVDFFTQMLPKPNEPINKTLNKPGIHEISSASWFYWAQARVMVSKHPFCTLTDSHGEFQLKNVPPGKYNVKAIRVNWNVASLEGDPEFPVPVRVNFEPDVVQTKTIEVGSQPISAIIFEFFDDLFKSTSGN